MAVTEPLSLVTEGISEYSFFFLALWHLLCDGLLKCPESSRLNLTEHNVECCRLLYMKMGF